MPQMDSVTFLPQVFWLLVVFSVFYLIVADKVLPTLSRILKTRSKKLSQGTDFSKLTDDECHELSAELSRTFSSTSMESMSSLQKLHLDTVEWQKIQVKPLKGSNAQPGSAQKSFNLSYFNVISTFVANKARYPTFLKLV